MKKSIQLLISAIAMVAILMLAPSGNGAFAQKTKATMKIGTYDSTSRTIRQRKPMTLPG
jgi:hypothetical protein